MRHLQGFCTKLFGNIKKILRISEKPSQIEVLIQLYLKNISHVIHYILKKVDQNIKNKVFW